MRKAFLSLLGILWNSAFRRVYLSFSPLLFASPLLSGICKDLWSQTYFNYSFSDLHDPDNHDGVIIHLEPDILECEVKWALESITMNKASGGDGILVELF